MVQKYPRKKGGFERNSTTLDSCRNSTAANGIPGSLGPARCWLFFPLMVFGGARYLDLMKECCLPSADDPRNLQFSPPPWLDVKQQHPTSGQLFQVESVAHAKFLHLRDVWIVVSLKSYQMFGCLHDVWYCNWEILGHVAIRTQIMARKREFYFDLLYRGDCLVVMTASRLNF